MHEPHGGLAELVRELLDVGESGMIVDRDVDEGPPDT
jgi:hypothetical protein